MVDRKCIGLSIIIRDENAFVLGCQTKIINCTCFPKEAEVLGLRESLRWIRALQLDNLILESDAKTVVEAYHSSSRDLSEFGTLITECRREKQGLNISFHHVNGQANMAV